MNTSHAWMNYVADTIREDTTFYYRKLSKYPSKSAILTYSIDCSFKKEVRLDFYTTEDDINMKKNCSDRRYKQFRNIYVVHNLFGSGGLCKDQMKKVRWKRKIKDYIPRNYAFSFGYRCTSKKMYSLKGLSFNISIIDPENETECISVPKKNPCFQYYKYASLPNLFGHDWEVKVREKILTAFALWDNPLSPIGFCHKHVAESVCYAFMPKCEEMQPVTHLCSETCYELKEACFNNITLKQAALKIFQGSNLYNATKLANMALSPELENLIDCSYLPSKNDTIPCFHKPVTCENPPNVPHATMSTDTNEPYSPYSQVEYSCNESFILQGNSTIECRYSGQWTQEPRCVLKPDPLLWKTVVTATALVVILVAIITIAFVVKMCRKKSDSELLTRQKLYDAFVCYSYGENDGEFAENTIRIHLEEKRPFKLCIHRRDFLAAWDIKWNIMNAIRNSNSAIIVMSQDYVNSLWCKEEFEDCYMENMKDTAFKLFVIMMQPIETLNNNNEYIKCFFDRKTYLERADPKLFKKIANYLAWVKKPKGNEELLVERRELLCDVDGPNMRQEEEPFPEYGIEEHLQVDGDGNGSECNNNEENNANNDDNDNDNDNYQINDKEYHKAIQIRKL